MADYPDFEGAKSKLFSVADWAAVEATDKNFYTSALNKAFGQYGEITYLVPAGKTLYLTDVTFFGYGNLAADRDKNQLCAGWIQGSPAPGILYSSGSNGGGGITFRKPIVITAGNTAKMRVYNDAGHNLDMGITVLGYEV